jgi:sterol desaturase/sphingolipid hydroxylase (fatty acid hydroxylase superfamily)
MSEAGIRLAVFLGVLAAMLWAERQWARGVVRPIGWRRWPGNLSLPVIGAALVRLVAPAGAVGVALWAEAQGLGLLPMLGLPAWLAVPLAILALDLAIYAQHRVFHHVPLLWRLHRMHHADPELDATTGLRFHPLEILLSLGIKAVVVVALGAPAVAVLAFELLLNATSLFNHADIRLPRRVDAVLRRVLVTPDMHRTHHSEVPAETDSCFGFCLPWWDRLFGTYRAAPAAGLDGAVIGVPGFRAAGEQRLDRLLLQPLRRHGSGPAASPDPSSQPGVS